MYGSILDDDALCWQALLDRARMYLSTGRWEDGRLDLSLVLGMGRGSAEILNDRGVCLYELGQYEQARAVHAPYIPHAHSMHTPCTHHAHSYPCRRWSTSTRRCRSTRPTARRTPTAATACASNPTTVRVGAIPEIPRRSFIVK